LSALSVTGVSSRSDEGTAACSHLPEQDAYYVQKESHKHYMGHAHVFGQEEIRWTRDDNLCD